jgi:hypothetical protein
MQDERGQPVSLGSGFFVKEHVVVTNYHVIEKAPRGYAKLVGEKTKYLISGIVGLDTKHDLVLLWLQGTSAPVLNLADSSKAAVGDTIFAVGNPQGLEGTFSQGIVSGLRQLSSDSLLQITAPISPGSSGGPVIDVEGKVVGVSVATFKEGQNLNFAIPSNYLKDMLQRASAEPEPLTSGRVKAPKSVFAALGGSKGTDGVAVRSFSYDGNLPGGGGPFSLSLVNLLKEPIKNVYCLLVFYDTEGSPIDVSVVRYSGVIPAGLAKRIVGQVEESVERLNCPQPAFPYEEPPPRRPKAKIDFRVLNFEMAE